MKAPARDYHEQLDRAVTAAHGLSGLIGGLAGGVERKDKTLGIPSSTATAAAARALIQGGPVRMVSNHQVALLVWQLWREIIPLQRFNPVWATMGDLLAQAKTLRRARGRAIVPALRELKQRVAEFERAERDCATRCRSLR